MRDFDALTYEMVFESGEESAEDDPIGLLDVQNMIRWLVRQN